MTAQKQLLLTRSHLYKLSPTYTEIPPQISSSVPPPASVLKFMGNAETFSQQEPLLRANMGSKLFEPVGYIDY